MIKIKCLIFLQQNREYKTEDTTMIIKIYGNIGNNIVKLIFQKVPMKLDMRKILSCFTKNVAQSAKFKAMHLLVIGEGNFKNTPPAFWSNKLTTLSKNLYIPESIFILLLSRDPQWRQEGQQLFSSRFLKVVQPLNICGFQIQKILIIFKLMLVIYNLFIIFA